MKCSYYTSIRILPSNPVPSNVPYEEFLELGEMAEELGYDRVLLSEHHFAVDEWSPSPMMALAALASRTKRIRLGTFVTLVAMHNPLRLAEDCATLDVLSNGRFDFSFGAGGSVRELGIFGVNPKESFGRTYESLSIMERCWTEEEFSHKGKYFTFEDVTMRPKPIQKSIPIYAGALGPKSQALSAKRGYNLCAAGNSPTWQNYEPLLREHNRDPKDIQFCSAPNFVHVAETKEQAWDEAEVGMHWSMDFYRHQGPQVGAPIMPAPPVGEFRKVSEAYGFPIAIGTPDDVLEALSHYKDKPVDELAAGIGYPAMPHEAAKRSLSLFAKECMPEIRRWGRTGA